MNSSIIVYAIAVRMGMCSILPYLATPTAAAPSRSFSTSDSELPFHIVVGMPALSPTMDHGTLAAWNVKEGDKFDAGDSLAKIETDKASIDYEAQDEGYVAKFLVEEDTSDIAINVPIMITVEEEDDVAAFANYTLPVEDVAAEVEATPEPEPVAAVAAVAATEPVVAATEPVVAAAEAVAVEPVAEPAPVVAAAATPTMAPAWGSSAKVSSPLAKSLGATQQKYIDMYGTTGQMPL